MSRPSATTERSTVDTRWGSFLVAAPLAATAQEAIGAAIAAHENIGDGPHCLKLRESTKVSHVATLAVDGWPSDVVVKEVRAPMRRRLGHLLGVPSRFAGDFTILDRLDSIGIRAPELLATQRRPRGDREYQISRFLTEAEEVSATLWGESARIDDPAARAELIAQLATWVRKLHDHGVWQRDLKLNNVMVTDNREFLVLDFSDLRFFSGGLSDERRVRNLGQVLDVPRDVEDEMYDRFLNVYCGDGGVTDSFRAGVDAAMEARRQHRQAVDGYRYVDGK